MTKKRSVMLTLILMPILTAVLLLLISASGSILSTQKSELQDPSELLLLTSVLQIVIFIFPCIIYYFLKGRKLNTPFMLTGIRSNYIMFMIVSCLLLLSGNLLIKCVYYITSDALPSGVDYIVSELPGFENVPAAPLILSAALVPAICEELFFRGVLLAEYRAFGGTNAVIISALCFAMIHFSIEAFPLYFFSGLVLGISASVTNSIFVPIIIHFISNILSIYLSDTFLRVTVQKSGAFFASFIVLILFLLSVVVFLSISEKILWKRSESLRDSVMPERSFGNIITVFLSPGFFILVLVFILMTVFS